MAELRRKDIDVANRQIKVRRAVTFTPDGIVVGPPKSDGLDVVPAAQFAYGTVSVAPALALAAIQQISARYVDPPRTVASLLTILDARYGMNAGLPANTVVCGSSRDCGSVPDALRP